MKRPLTGLLILTALLLALFIQKPFHIDDAYQLRVAQQVRSAPTRPYEALYNWTGVPAPLWLNNLHPPLNAYILAGAISMTGESEAPLHTAYLLFALGCIFWMFLISRALCKHPALPVLLTIVSPAFLLSATSIMTDIPSLFFWLGAVWFARTASERGRALLLWPAGLFATAAAMTNLFGLSLVPLLLADWALRSRRLTPHLAGLFLPVAIVGLWGLYSIQMIGFFHPGAAAYFAASAPRHLGPSFAIAAAFIGGCLAWPLLLLPAAPRLGRLSAAAAFLWVFLWYVMPAGTGTQSGGLWPILALAGVFSVMIVLDNTLKRPNADSLLLLLWVLGTLVFAAGLNWTVSARSILPCAFPASLAAIRWLETLPQPNRYFTAMRCAVIPILCLTLHLALADQGMARAQKELAQSTVRKLSAAGHRIFFIGHWGFQHYMEREGAIAFNYKKPTLSPGDILFVSLNNTGTDPLPQKLRATVQTALRLPIPNPYRVQTMDVTGRRAGFYSSLFGPVPFGFGKDLTYDTFLIETLRAGPRLKRHGTGEEVKEFQRLGAQGVYPDYLGAKDLGK